MTKMHQMRDFGDLGFSDLPQSTASKVGVSQGKITAFLGAAGL
jgi:hypothetical protein